MQPRKSLLLWVLVFVVLDLYVNLVPRYFDQTNLGLWLAYWLAFFGLAALLARYVLRLRGLQAFGLRRHKGWLQNLGIGFLVGAGIYALKSLIYYCLGKFEVAGLMDAAFVATLLAQAVLAMFFSSAINDVLIRGYWLAGLRQKHLMPGYLLLTTLLYVLDDGWNEGLLVENMIFSAILGITLAYTVVKTGSIWLSIGLHWGGNVLFRVLYGFGGQGVWQLENVTEAPLFDYIGLAVTALLFPAVYMIILKTNLVKVAAPEEPEPAALPADLAATPKT